MHPVQKNISQMAKLRPIWSHFCCCCCCEPCVPASFVPLRYVEGPAKAIEILDLEQVCWHRSCKYFWGKKHPRQGNLLQRNIFSAVYKTSLYYIHKIGWRPAEKNSPFFSTCVFYEDFYGQGY
jgi:hypothetical protein